MPSVLVDTSVLFAAAYRRDRNHEVCREILTGIDAGDLPSAVVLDYVLAETLNGLVRKASGDAAADFLDRLEANAAFSIARLSSEQLSTAKSVFRRRQSLSLVDAAIVAYMRTDEREFLYSLDDDFDRIDEVTRLDTSVNPFQP